jgi:peptidyl-dipeptidase Dcp
MENWADEPEVLKVYARHYRTGEVIPDALVTKMENAGKFNMGFITTEFLAAAYLDMKYHTLVSRTTFARRNLKRRKWISWD